MPDEPNPQPAQQASAPPTATPPAAPQAMLDDPLMEQLRKDLEIAVGENTPAPIVVPEIKPVVEAPPVVPTGTPAAPAKPKFVRRDRAADIDRAADLAASRTADRIRQQSTPPPLPPKVEETIDHRPAPVVAAGDEGLSTEQLKELELARYAEKAEPAKYKGKADALAAFYKKADEYHAKHSDDPDRTFDENDDDYLRFIRENKPKWKPGEVDSLRERKVSDETTARVRKEFEPELNKLRRSTHEAKVAPLVEKQVEDFERGLLASLKSEDPLESEIFTNTRGQFVNAANQYLRIANGITEFNPADRLHVDLANFVNYQSNEFDTKGGDARTRGGKTFLHPVKYNELANAGSDVSRNWTFAPKDVLEMLALDAKTSAQERVKQEEEQAAKRGFTRTKPAQTPKQENQIPEPTQLGGPRATTAAAPGAVSVPSTINMDDHPGMDIIRTLGLDAK